MKISVKILFFASLFFMLIGCGNFSRKQKEKTLIVKKYGRGNLENDSLGVVLQLNEHKDWEGIMKQVDRIVCNDSIPKLIIKTDDEIKEIYLKNPCWSKYTCILIKQRNVITIHNDTINKNDDFYPLDSIKWILKRDWENNGENPMLSDNPDKLLIGISYDRSELKTLPETLDKLLQAYEQVTGNRNIKIIFISKREVSSSIFPHPKEIEEDVYNIKEE